MILFRALKFIAIAAAVSTSMARADPSASELEAAHQAELRGSQLFDYDQAAWHATDSFQAELAKSGIGNEALQAKGLQGFIVEPADNDELLVTFFGNRADSLFAFARYWTAKGQVRRGGILGDQTDAELSAVALRLIAARGKAIETAIADKAALCSKSPPNIIVLPPDRQNVVSAYLLTSTTQAGLYPGGGHYRYDFSGEGALLTKRQFMKTCFDFDSRTRNGSKPEAAFVTHLLDPQPTEIHVFVSYNVPIPLGVITVANNEVWEVAHGKIVFSGKAEKSP